MLFWGGSILNFREVDHAIFPQKNMHRLKKNARSSRSLGKRLLQALVKMVKKSQNVNETVTYSSKRYYKCCLFVAIEASPFWGKGWHRQRQVPFPVMSAQHMICNKVSCSKDVSWQSPLVKRQWSFFKLRRKWLPRKQNSSKSKHSIS